MLPTTSPDMTCTLENLKRELEATGLKVEICKGFVSCKFTPTKKQMDSTVTGLCIRFKNNLVTTNKTEKGFYLAFSL